MWSLLHHQADCHAMGASGGRLALAVLTIAMFLVNFAGMGERAGRAESSLIIWSAAMSYNATMLDAQVVSLAVVMPC